MSPAKPSTAKKMILVVEDEKPLSYALQIKLSQEGYDVIIAEDGEKALQRVRKQHFDLILLDIIMPKKDGFAFLEELQKSSASTVMVLSNLGQDDDIRLAKELGAKEYLVKANNPMSKIVDKVKTVLGE